MNYDLSSLEIDLLKCGAYKEVAHLNDVVRSLERSLETLPESCSSVILEEIERIKYKISVLNEFIEKN